MRIAVLGIKTMPAFAGADRVAERLLENLPGHDFVVYVLRNGARPAARPGREYVALPGLPGKHLRAFSYFLLCALHFVIRGGADVVHVHNSDFGLFVPLLKLRRGVRVVGTIHGSHYGELEREKWGRGARLFLRFSERIFVRSCDVVTSVAPVPDVFDREIVVIPNGVDAWSRPEAGGRSPFAALDLTPRGYVLFAAGRLDRTKGLHHLLAAYRLLPDAPPLLAVADFSHDARYTAEIEDLAETDTRVRLHRSLVDRDTLLSAVVDAAVFVFPSEFEAMSMMLLEAIACGTPVVCSHIPENRAVVGDDYPLLFRSQDPGDLARALDRALAADADRSAVQTTYERVRKTFRWDEIGAAYGEIYRGASGPSVPRWTSP